VFDTLLPLVRGQRIGLFAGSGVGKSRLLGLLANAVEADVIVIGLIGERGREVRDFVQERCSAWRRSGQNRGCRGDLGSVGPGARARCLDHDGGGGAFSRRGSACAGAGGFHHPFRRGAKRTGRRGGRTVRALRLSGLHGAADHGAGRTRGARRAGQGDITAAFSVLVAGSDMEGPVADIMRGVLDGHVVLSREIAERGRFPADRRARVGVARAARMRRPRRSFR
jgi:flagellum-specific ATP synthase